MERVVISRKGNGVTVAVGNYVVRRSSYSFIGERERTIEYGAPRVTFADDAAPTSWPLGAPAPEKVRWVSGDRSDCGDYVVASFHPVNGWKDTEVIIRWEDIDGIAQTLANTEAVEKVDP